ncbi:DUF6880 family protein [Roseomonas sp. WA12]
MWCPYRTRSSGSQSQTLNARKLEAFGTARLAEPLRADSNYNAAARRQLRSALAGRSGAGETARAITKQGAGSRKRKRGSIGRRTPRQA